MALGYDPGPIDGEFGLLTEEAVYQLQADYHLRRDGVAGRQVAQLLGAGLPSGLRLVHSLSPGDDLYDLAERYGVSPAFLRRLARDAGSRDLAPGTRLVIPVRPVLGMVEESEPQSLERLRRALSRHRKQVTALVAPWLSVAPDGTAGGKVDAAVWELAQDFSLPLVAQVRVAAPDGLVPTGRRRRQAVGEIARVASRYRLPGLYLLFDPLAPGERYAAATLTSALHRALPPSTQLYLEVAQELQRVADLAEVDRLVVRLPSQSSEEDYAPVRRLLRRHPCYRLFLGLSATGSRAGFSARLSLVTRLTLSGVVLWDLAAGQEDVFRAMADLFAVQVSQAWATGRRNIRELRA